MFTEDYQVSYHCKLYGEVPKGFSTIIFLHTCLVFSKVTTIEQYFPVFDKLRKEFLVGELIWNFADFMTKQGSFFFTFYLV